MAGEDFRFCRHRGFDWGAVATAWDRYQSGHGRVLGASTISMQTAKNVFLWPGRDWLRKGFEAWFTALIELAWGKRRSDTPPLPTGVRDNAFLACSPTSVPTTCLPF